MRNKLLILIAATIVLILLSGCTASKNPKNTNVDIHKLINEYKNTKVKVYYYFNSTIGEPSDNFEIIIEKTGNKSKIVYVYSPHYITATYKNHTSIYCKEEIKLDQRSISCNLSNVKNIVERLLLLDIDKNETKNISFKGIKYVNGRKCVDFTFTPNESFWISHNFNWSPKYYVKDNGKFEICLDERYGIPLLIKESIYSKLANKSVVLFTITASKISFEVNDKDFYPPFDFSLNRVTCSDEEVIISVIPFSSKLEFTWNTTIDNGTIKIHDIIPTKIQVVKIHTHLKEGQNLIKICYKGNCQTEYCFHKNRTNVNGNRVIKYKEGLSIEETNSKENLIKNGDFSDDLKYWKVFHTSNVNDVWEVKVINDSNFTNVLHIERKNSESDGGSTGVLQELNVNVSNYMDLRFKASINVIYHSLEGGGWWTINGEYPLHIYIHYLDSNGTDRVWSWGFLNNYDQWYNNYNIVDPSEWYYFESQNLMELDPRPVVITNITIAGNGWDFESMIDNVALVEK